jgi:hypothetical protein
MYIFLKLFCDLSLWKFVRNLGCHLKFQIGGGWGQLKAEYCHDSYNTKLRPSVSGLTILKFQVCNQTPEM